MPAQVTLKANEVKRLRMERAWSQADLADIAGVRQATISNAEAGRLVRYATIAAIAGALQVEVASIVEVTL